VETLINASKTLNSENERKNRIGFRPSVCWRSIIDAIVSLLALALANAATARAIAAKHPHIKD
jgi:hypothetical protein